MKINLIINLNNINTYSSFIYSHLKENESNFKENEISVVLYSDHGNQLNLVAD
jgi:hypothetical protein